MQVGDAVRVQESWTGEIVHVGMPVWERHEVADMWVTVAETGTRRLDDMLMSQCEPVGEKALDSLRGGDPCPNCDAPMALCSPSGRGTAACDACHVVYGETD